MLKPGGKTYHLPRMKSCREGKGVIETGRVLWRPRDDGERVSILWDLLSVMLERKEGPNRWERRSLYKWSLTQCRGPTAYYLHPQARGR